MNRRQRREFNRQNKTQYTKSDFITLELLMKIRAGNLSVKELDDIKLFNDDIHIDNTDLVPDGTVVKLNYEYIKSRPQKDLTQKFIQWVEENKDTVFHVKRDKETNPNTALVGLEENGFWLFDTYADLLYQKDGEWVYLTDIEDKMLAEAEESPEEDSRTKAEKIL